MPKNYKVIFLSLFFIVFIIMIVAILWVNQKVENNKIDAISDNVLTLFRHELQIQKSNALFLSVALSEDKELKDALLADDEETGYRILIDKLNKLKKYTFIKDVRTQLLTQELDIFARSWDNAYAGMPLEGLREDLQLIKKVRQPKVSIDPGRLLTIKATTPFKNADKIIGFIEAIKTFDEITSILRKRDIELSVLMYDEYLNVATLMRENASFGSFVISNRNYNHIVFKDLKEINPTLFERENHLETAKFLHVLDEMRDSAGDKIGYYVLSVPHDKLGQYENMKESISFFLNLSKNDLYDVTQSNERKHGAYKSLYDRSFINLLGNLNPKEKEQFEEQARSILENYNKEELINIILNKQYQEVKKGEIR